MSDMCANCNRMVAATVLADVIWACGVTPDMIRDAEDQEAFWMFSGAMAKVEATPMVRSKSLCLLVQRESIRKRVQQMGPLDWALCSQVPEAKKK